MKKIVLLCSHAYSGSNILYDGLSNALKVQGIYRNHVASYVNSFDFYNVIQQPHKFNSVNALFLDEVLFNFQISTADVYKYCKFIYLIRDPEFPINCLLTNKKKLDYAVSYYKFRLNRIYQYSKRTPDAVFLTWNNLKNQQGLDLIQNYLQLPNNIEINESDILSSSVNKNILNAETLEDLANTYEKYVYLIKKNCKSYNF